MYSTIKKKLDAMKSGDIVSIKVSRSEVEEVYRYVYENKLDIISAGDDLGNRYPTFRLRKP